MAAIHFSITPEGLTASLDAANTGLGLQLTHVSGHNAAGVEIGRWPLSGGIVEPNSNTLRFSSVMTSTSRKELYGLKLLGDSLVFATAVGASPLVVVDANIDFAPAFGLALGQIPVGSITVSTDPNAPLAIILMLQHVGSAHPHPQYTLYNAFIAAINSLQEQLNMTQLAMVVTAINQAFLQMNKSLPKVGDIKSTASAMTAAQFTAAQNDGSVWEVYAAGRVIVGAGSVTIDYSAAVGEAARPNETQNFTAGSVGGELDHKQTTAEMRNHGHSEGIYDKFTALALDALNAGDVVDQNGDGVKPTTVGADNVHPESELQVADISSAQLLAMTEKKRGSSQPFNVMQPYIVACHFVCVTAANQIPAIVFPTA